MEGGVAVSYGPAAIQQAGCGLYYPGPAALRPAGPDPAEDRRRQYVHGCSGGQVHSTRILQNILCMKQETSRLAPSPPGGQGYVMIPQREDPYSPQSRYPTPPSSYPGSPQPVPQHLEGGLSLRSSPHSTRTNSPTHPGASPAMGLNVDFHYTSSPDSRRSSISSQASCSSSSRDGYECCRVNSTERTSPASAQDNDQPMNLKKRRRSLTPPPRPQFNTAEDGEQPMDLSCPKKARITDSPNHGHYDHDTLSQRSNSGTFTASQKTRTNWLYCAKEVANKNESILKSILCGELRSQTPSPVGKEMADDVRTESPFLYSLSTCHGLTRNPKDRVSELIQKAKLRAAATSAKSKPTPVRPETGSAGTPLPVQVAESEPQTGSPKPAMSRDTVVSLAKKNLLPVSARISEWLLKVVQFVKSLPEFASLSQNDKLSLLQGAWSRLLLLQMAENHFQFAVNPSCAYATTTTTTADVSGSGSGHSPTPTPPRPTLDTVESITGFIRKCQGLGIGAEEMNYLKLLTLFNPSKYRAYPNH